ncbi:hypothetical protein JTB14_015950 [Gonioctena quinquepunctata]|nr:hypothetical protein JTB14_015950 [Gonioctena quinquepunctata]
MRNLESRSQGSSILSHRRDILPVRANARNLENTESNIHGSSILSRRRDILPVSADAREIQPLANAKRRIASENMILEDAESMYDLNVTRSINRSGQGVPLTLMNMFEHDIFVQENQEIAKGSRIETVTHESRQN